MVGDTLVSTDRGLVPIATLMGANQIDPVSVGVVQEGNRFGKAAFSYRGGLQPTVRIETRYGYSIEGTHNHRVRVMRPDGTIGWAHLGEIRHGDQACIVPYGSFGPGADLSGFRYVASPKKGTFQSIDVQFPSVLTPEWGRLFGYLVGDGSCTSKTSLVLACAESDVQADQLGLLRSLLGNAHSTPDNRPSSGLCPIRSSRTQARAFAAFAGLGYDRAGEKEVPWAIMASPKDVVAQFLRGYMEADGYVSDNNIEVTTKSERLARQIQILFLQFGVVSRLSAKPHKTYGNYWRLAILAPWWSTYINEIGFVSPRKTQAAQQLLDSWHRQRGQRRTLTNTMEVEPYQQRHIRNFANLPSESRTLHTDRLSQCRHPKSRSQCTTRQIAKIVTSYSAFDAESHFFNLMPMGYFYDPVVSVTSGQADVFDLTVPDGEMFAANGFMNHNTTLGRIMARALMCESPKDNGDPCDECQSCVSILETGNSMDFVEVDAATNSGKADVQKITEEIQYSTFAGRRRIYLFDEAHQLSKDALDALLKPLEENIPGTQEKRLVCIFCTTEPEKMKATIFSRCAPTFVIQPVMPADIAKRLAYVCDQEGFEYDVDMLHVIAEMTECHIRDALKSVEGVSMLGKLNRENVAKYLKLDMNLMFIDVLENLGKDLGKVLGFAKQAMLRASPATCYEKLASVAMLSYQVGIGALKAPLYIESGRLERLYAAQQHNLIGFASKFSSRVGRPNESMLLCDLGALHYGGSAIGNAQIVMVQSSASVSDNNGNHSAPIFGKMNAPLSSSGIIKRAEVRTNPKAIGGYQPAPLEHLAGAKGCKPEIDPAMFGFLLAIQIAHYEGMQSGPAGRPNMGGD